MSRNLYEVFEKIVDYKDPTDANVAHSLRQYVDNYAVRELLRMNFDPEFVGFDLPEGEPPYTKDEKQPYGYAETHLTREVKKLYIFLKDFTKITQKRKEALFIQLLESLHYRESELLLAIKDKKLTELFPDINELLIRDIFPDMLPSLGRADLIDAAVIRGANTGRDMENLPWKKYTPKELEHLFKTKQIVFKFPEHAKICGVYHLSMDYIPEPKQYDPELYIEAEVTKNLFGVVTKSIYHMPIAEINEKVKGSTVRFIDINRAIELGIDRFDISRIAAVKEAKEKARRARKLKKEKAMQIEKKPIVRPRKTVVDTK